MKNRLHINDIDKNNYNFSVNWKRVLIGGGSVIIVLLIYAFWSPFFIAFSNPGNDWQNFENGINAMMQGINPYSLPDFYVPPWIFFLFPLTLVNHNISTILVITLATISWIYILKKKNVSLRLGILFMATPQLLWGIIYGNVDWLVALGTIMTPQIGLFFILLKPQIGAFIALFWLYDSYINGGIKKVATVFGPVILAYIISFLIFGMWPLVIFNSAVSESSNFSFFPKLIPIGLVLIYKSLKERNENLSLLSSPFLSPYFASQSIPVALLGLLNTEVESMLAIIGLWIVWFFNGNVL